MKQLVFIDASCDPSIDLGYLKNFNQTYIPAKRIGRGSNGSVFTVIRRRDQVKFACKVIPKKLTDETIPQSIRAAQLSFIRREVEVLLALRGTLNVASLEQVYEDPNNVFFVMELCKGGEVVGCHSHYTELEVATIMRSVLQTIAQCNAHGIIHRDIKPENFLLLSKSKDSAVKAIDFGLAAFYSNDALPVTAPQPSGTLWYMSPDATRAEWYPTSDVWSAGVMAAFMLVGVCPFVDRVTPEDPSPSRVFNCIRTQEFDSTGPKWNKMSCVTVDFVRHLLVKDPLKRPTASEALMHPFLQQVVRVAPISSPNMDLVQRLQRFAQHGVFKRCILEHVAADFLEKRLSIGEATSPERLAWLLSSLDVNSDGKVEREDLQVALQHMGFRINDHEAAELFDAVDVERRGSVKTAELLASLLDWSQVQKLHSTEWLDSVRRVFVELDRDGDGALSEREIAALFVGHMEPYEVEAVVHEALLEALGVKTIGTADDMLALKIGSKNTSKRRIQSTNDLLAAASAASTDSSNCSSPTQRLSIDFKHLLHLLENEEALDDLRLFDDRVSPAGMKHSASVGQLEDSKKRCLGGHSFSKKSGSEGMRRVLSWFK